MCCPRFACSQKGCASHGEGKRAKRKKSDPPPTPFTPWVLGSRVTLKRPPRAAVCDGLSCTCAQWWNGPYSAPCDRCGGRTHRPRHPTHPRRPPEPHCARPSTRARHTSHTPTPSACITYIRGDRTDGAACASRTTCAPRTPSHGGWNTVARAGRCSTAPKGGLCGGGLGKGLSWQASPKRPV